MLYCGWYVICYTIKVSISDFISLYTYIYSTFKIQYEPSNCLVSFFHFHHVCVTEILLRMLFISFVERIRFNYVTSLLWVMPIGPPPPMLLRLVSWNRLQQRNKFMHALRKPRFMKQYVIGLQQLDEYANNCK